jgi:hypothetical protein
MNLDCTLTRIYIWDFAKNGHQLYFRQKNEGNFVQNPKFRYLVPSFKTLLTVLLFLKSPRFDFF